MQKGIIMLILFMLAPFAAWSATYKVVADQSELKWHATKVTGEHNGTIALQSGTLEWSDDTIKGGKFNINMKSIKNLDVQDPKYNKDLTTHLQSDDFFSAKKYPVGVFEIGKVTKDSGDEYKVEGTLSLKGISKPIQFPAKIEHDGKALRITGKAELDRTQWDIKYRSGKFFPNVGDKLIHDKFIVEMIVMASEDVAAPMKSKAKKK